MLLGHRSQHCRSESGPGYPRTDKQAVGPFHRRRNASAAGLHHTTFARLRVARACTSVDVSYLAVTGRLAGGRRGKKCRCRQPWQLLRRRLAWKDTLLPLALAGPAGDLKNALLRCRLGCCVADCLTSQEKEKTGMKRSGPTLSAFRWAGWPGGSGTGGLRVEAPTSALWPSWRGTGGRPPSLLRPAT